MAAPPDCVICRGEAGDLELDRAFVWSDRLWRLSTSLRASILGFSYLEPRRHIPYVADLDGPEADSLGTTLVRVTRFLRDQADADFMWVLVLGEHVPHLHFNIAPRRVGDALLVEPVFVDPTVPKPTPAEHSAFVDRLRTAATAL